jgi:flagellar basal body rod protein FlgG
MFLSSSLSAALDCITERAADVRRAFTPGAVPGHDDVATPETLSDVTYDPLAVVAPDGAYFMAVDDDGRRTYTRDGALTIHAGRLVDAEGMAILGIRAPGGTLGELTVDPVDDALGRINGLHIERDGSVAYGRDVVDPRSGANQQQRVIVGRIALVRFPAGTKLETNDGSHCVPPSGIVPTSGLPGDGTFAPLLPMRRERSRIDVDESLVRLKDAYLAFDALRAAETAKAHLGQTTMDLVK